MPDLFTPLPGETLMAFLVRTRPDYEWTDAGGTTEPYAVAPIDPFNGIYGRVRPRLTSAEFAAIVSTTYPPPVSVDAPPAWPGEDGVTLGEPAELVDQLELAGPMDGVLVHVTTPPTKTGLRRIGGQLYDYGVGELAFGADNGYIEPWQYLGFRTGLFTPKSMKRASVCYFRVLAGAGGTATPWTVGI